MIAQPYVLYITPEIFILDEKKNAKEVAAKYMKNKPLDVQTLAKCYRHILSKGFSYDSASDAVSYVKKLYGGDGDDLTGD